MKAVRIHAYADPAAIRYEEAPTPAIQDDELLIKVAAAGINPIDWKIQQGYFEQFIPHKLPFIPGWDVAGSVEKAGAAVEAFKVGDRVYAMADVTRDGCYAEYAAVKASRVARVPRSISINEAASIPLAAQTAWTVLFEAGGMKAGQSVLVHAAGGGVGMFAVQLAKNAGAYVVGTCSAANAAFVKSLGADEAIDYAREDFAASQRFDLVVDAIGGETQAKSLSAIRSGGTLISIASPVDEKAAAAQGVRAAFAGTNPSGELLGKLAAIIDAGKLKTLIAETFPLKDAAKALELSRGGHVRGKIILAVAG